MPQRKSPVRTPALLAANRANARLSTGPRTREGRRRSALNRRRMRFSILPRAEGRDARDALGLWRDLMAQFWFIKPLGERRPPRFERSRHLQSSLERLAWAWYRKLRWVRMGASREDLASSNRWIEGDLWSFLFEFRVLNRKADDWLRKQFGSDGRACMAPLREAIEARLGPFSGARERRTRAGKPGAGGACWRGDFPSTAAGHRPPGGLWGPLFQTRTGRYLKGRRLEAELDTGIERFDGNDPKRATD